MTNAFFAPRNATERVQKIYNRLISYLKVLQKNSLSPCPVSPSHLSLFISRSNKTFINSLHKPLAEDSCYFEKIRFFLRSLLLLLYIRVSINLMWFSITYYLWVTRSRMICAIQQPALQKFTFGGYGGKQGITFFVDMIMNTIRNVKSLFLDAKGTI